jgi:iron complex outermembrane receptor protein
LTVLTNAKGATIYGVDGDITARINDNWKINVGGAYLHGTYTSFPGATLTTPTFECVIGGVIQMPKQACSGGVGTTYSTGNSQVPIDASGKDLIRAPQVTADLTATYDHPLPFGSFEGSATVAYNGGFYWDPYNEFHEPAYTILDANLSWISPDSTYRVSLWGTNLTGQKYNVWLAPASTGTTQVLGRPLSVGVSLAIKLR